MVAVGGRHGLVTRVCWWPKSTQPICNGGCEVDDLPLPSTIISIELGRYERSDLTLYLL